MVKFFSNEMIFAKINAEKDDSLIAKRYHVSGYPTFILTDSKGIEIDRIIGYAPAKEFLQIVDNYKNGIGTLNDLLAKAEGSDDRQLFFDIADKYKYSGGSEEAQVWFAKVVETGDPRDSLSQDSRFSMADMKLRGKDYDTAVAAFEAIKADFKGEELEETAAIYIPYTLMKKGDTTNSIANFEAFIKQFPESDDVEFATKQISNLKGETQPEK